MVTIDVDKCRRTFDQPLRNLAQVAAGNATRDGSGRGQTIDPIVIVGTMVVVLAAIGILWAVPVLVAWVHSGRFVELSIVDSVKAVADERLRGADPASAYPRAAAVLMPGPWGFWTTGMLLILTVGGLLGAVGRAAEIRMSRAAADRRWWQLRGRRPHEFARYRTVPELIVPGPSPDRVIVGHFARPRSLIAISDSVQMAVLAAPPTGKSSGLVIPANREHEGPVVT
ncbi:MAG: type secretion system protein VirD4, partial [Solirubrobacteraceae bacterium]